MLAATLTANYGIYGRLSSWREHPPNRAAKNIQLREIRDQSLGSAKTLQPKAIDYQVEPDPAGKRALQSNQRLHFHPTDNPSLICYSKRTADGSNTMLVVVNLDPFLVQTGWVDLDLDVLGLAPGDTFEVYDLLADHSYRWQGSRNYVALRPAEAPAHLFRVVPAGREHR